MDLKRFEKLKVAKDKLRDEVRAIDNVLVIDTEMLNIFKANNIFPEDISRLLGIKSFPDYATMFGYWDTGGELSTDNNSLDYVLKILSMSKNDLAYIISKSRVLGKMFNLESCYFNSLMNKLENSKEVFNGSKVLKADSNNTEIDKLSDEVCIKLDKAIITLSQILSMVNTSIELTFNDFDMLFRNEQQELKGLFNFTTGESISIDSSRVIMFNDSGALVVYSGDTLGEVVAGNSDIAIKLYEDLLVGYKKNNKAAVYYSSLFTKYIIS